jgi:hypothetical protein
MAKLITKANEYGQLELNQVAFRRDGRIIAQYKLDSEIDYVENGMILAVDYVNKTIKYPAADQTTGIALNYTTEHMYDERLAHGLKHFKLDKGSFLPRLGYLATGDKFTTNCIAVADDAAAGDKATEEEVKAVLATAKYGKVCALGAIELTDDAANAVVAVVKEDTMPDGQFAVKFIAL